MQRSTHHISFDDESDPSAQREAAFEILSELRDFFMTDDFQEIYTKIDDERLSNDGLSERHAEEIIAMAESVAREASRLEDTASEHLYY